MSNESGLPIETVIEYIESHLDGKLDLERVSQAVHYSRYHLHRMFTETVGMTLHDYVQRRQLTQAASLLAYSARPIMEIALVCGYESQQAFSAAFKAMYKMPPARFRESGQFYPLQLRFALEKHAASRQFLPSDIRLAVMDDLPSWMNLMHLVIDGYPVMDEDDYLRAITRSIEEGRALVLMDGSLLIGALAFSGDTGSIDFWGIHPQYRRHGAAQAFLCALVQTYLPGREISMTTYREGDKADTGYRALLEQLGFVPGELLVEYGYPTQRFVLPTSEKGGEGI